MAYFWHKALPSYRRIPSLSKSEEISALEEYKKELEDEKASIEEELREVEKRLEELKKEKLNKDSDSSTDNELNAKLTSPPQRTGLSILRWILGI